MNLDATLRQVHPASLASPRRPLLAAPLGWKRKEGEGFEGEGGGGSWWKGLGRWDRATCRNRTVGMEPPRSTAVRLTLVKEKRQNNEVKAENPMKL